MTTDTRIHIRVFFSGMTVGLVAVGAFLTVWFWQGCGTEIKKITITKTIPGKSRIIYVPRTPEEMKACMDSIITMTAPDFMLIESADMCKSNVLGVQLDCKAPERKNSITVSPLFLVTFRGSFGFEYGAQVQYMRSIIAVPRLGTFGIGAGVIVTNKSAGITAGASVSW
jgi:hypothetical protein